MSSIDDGLCNLWSYGTGYPTHKNIENNIFYLNQCKINKIDKQSGHVNASGGVKILRLRLDAWWFSK